MAKSGEFEVVEEMGSPPFSFVLELDGDDVMVVTEEGREVVVVRREVLVLVKLDTATSSSAK